MVPDPCLGPIRHVHREGGAVGAVEPRPTWGVSLHVCSRVFTGKSNHLLLGHRQSTSQTPIPKQTMLSAIAWIAFALTVLVSTG